MPSNVKAKTMKAANLYAPGDIRVEEVPMPTPKAGEVLIKVKACGVCGSDIPRVMKTGTYRYPTIPGHEFSGEIVELGEMVEGFNVGDRVAVIPLMPCGSCEFCQVGEYQLCDQYNYLGSRTNGAYAEYVVAPAANLLRLADNVTFEDGAMTDPASVALHAVRKLGLLPGDRVAVFGLGPIGLLALQWSKIMGAGHVFAIDIFEEKLQLARELGADDCINGRLDDPVMVIKDVTKGKGVERAIEFAGNKITQEQCIESTGKLGCCAFGGISHTDLPLSEHAVDGILRKELTIRGSWNSSFSPSFNDWERSLYFMSTGKLRCKPIISHRLPLSKIPEAFKMMYEREEYFSKVMFLPEI